MVTHTKSADQNINPLGGGNADEFASQVRVSRIDVDFEDDGTPLTIGDFPSGATLVGAWIAVTTAFDSGTSDLLDIGVDGDVDAFAADEDVSSAGVVVATFDGAGPFVLTADDNVAVQYDSAGTAPTAGAAEVLVQWLPPVPA